MTDVFKATYKDQYVQSTYIKAGTFTFQARVMFQSDSPDGKYSISFTDEDGGVHVVNLNWQIEPNIWCEVVQTIELERPMVEFSLMASPLFSGESVLIGLPQHEEGNTKSTPRANPLDESEATQNEFDLVRTYISSQVDILEDRIVLKVGEYQIGGKNLLRNFDGRFGMDYWSAGAEFVDETGALILVTISSVTAPNPVLVYTNGVPEVPTEVRLILDDGSFVYVPVTWGAIDTSIVGTYEIAGTYSLPDGVIGEMPDVFLEVRVGAVTVLSVTPLAAVTVDQYKPAPLPTTIQLNLNDSSSVTVPVTWGQYNTSTAGTFEATAIYDLPAGVTGYKPIVKITIVVNAVADTGTFIDLIPYYLNHPDVEVGESDGLTWVKCHSAINLNDLIPQTTAGVSVLWFHHFGGVGSGAERVDITYNDDSKSYVYFWGTTGMSSEIIGTSGKTIKGISTNTGNKRFYRLQIRNDGSTPPWA